MGSRGQTLVRLPDLGLLLRLSSPGLFLEWDSWLGGRKELWEAISGSWWDWKFCLRPWNFGFLFGLALVPSPAPDSPLPPYLALKYPLPTPFRDSFPHL